MNKLLSSLMLATLTLLATIPFGAAPAAAAGGAILSVDPSLNSGHIGDTFQVAVDLSGQSGLVGYDFSLRYNNAVLACVGFDDNSGSTVIGPFVASGQAINFVSECTQPTAVAEGVARSAWALAGGISTNVLSAPLAVITFQVIADGNSDLTISNGQLVCVSGSSTGPCASPSILNSSFLIAPNVNLVAPNAVEPNGCPPVRFLRKAQTTVCYAGFMQLSASDLRAGFGAILLTATDPLGNQVFAQSDVAFMFPGQTATVTLTIDFSGTPTIGTWSVTATVLDCANPSVCIAGPSGPAQFFKVKP